MPHPVHDILKRFLDIEQFAFDTDAGEYWPAPRHEARPSERFVQAFVGDNVGRDLESRGDNGMYRELESES